MRELIIDVGEEAMRVGHDLGHPVEPIFGLTEAELAGSNRPAEKLFDTLATHVGPGRSRNTVLQDLLKGRLSEVDMINGLVVEESERRGYGAPANARVAAIVRQIEAGTLKPDVANMANASKCFATRRVPRMGRAPPPRVGGEGGGEGAFRYTPTC